MKVPREYKTILALNCMVPAALLGYDAARHQLGANPVNFAIHTTGMLALIYLLLSLTITPVMRLTGLNWLVSFRRVLGLYAFYHTLLHFVIFFWWDRSHSVSSTLTEIITRKYLIVGTLGLLMMTPLAVTSTDAMIKRLGAKRWKALHRLAYLCAIAGVVHYYMLVKSDVTQPEAFIIALSVLLGFRLVYHYWQLRSGYNRLRSAPGFPPVMPALAAKPRFWKGQLKVARIFEETPDVRTFRLAPVSGKDLPFDYMPGQYLNLTLMVDGKRVNRSYTIASSPTRGGCCELTVKREEMGISSRHLHDTCPEGTILDIAAPAGKFTFTGVEAESVVMIAGGVGITPLMSKIRYLTDLSWNGTIYFFFSAKTEGDIIFREEIEYLRRRYPNLHITITLTRAESESWNGERGRISPEMLTRIVPELSKRRFHICGPTEMTEATQTMLRGLGVKDEQIRVESFISASRVEGGKSMVAEDAAIAEESVPAETMESASADGGMITFSRSGKSAQISAAKSILEASEDLGVNIDFDCRSGICGQCKTKLLSGRVTMDVEDALDAADRAKNLILCCQAHCMGDVVVEA